MNAPARLPSATPSAFLNLALFLTGSTFFVQAFKEKPYCPRSVSKRLLGTALLLYSLVHLTRRWIRHRRTGGGSTRYPQLHIDESIVLYAKPGDLFAYWKDLRNLCELVPAIHSISATSDGRHRWTLITPGRELLRWKTQMVRQQEDHSIIWQSTSGSPITSGGALFFNSLGNGRTQLRVILRFQHTDSPESQLLAASIGGATSKALRTNLRHFKQGARELFAPAGALKQEHP